MRRLELPYTGVTDQPLAHFGIMHHTGVPARTPTGIDAFGGRHAHAVAPREREDEDRAPGRGSLEAQRPLEVSTTLPAHDTRG